MITRYHTVFSIYEVDWVRMMVRRLEGENSPTMRQGEDGVWKPFASCLVTEYGLDITWSITPELVMQKTITSEIIWQEEVVDADA